MDSPCTPSVCAVSVCDRAEAVCSTESLSLLVPFPDTETWRSDVFEESAELLEGTSGNAEQPAVTPASLVHARLAYAVVMACQAEGPIGAATLGAAPSTESAAPSTDAAGMPTAVALAIGTGTGTDGANTSP